MASKTKKSKQKGDVTSKKISTVPHNHVMGSYFRTVGKEEYQDELHKQLQSTQPRGNIVGERHDIGLADDLPPSSIPSSAARSEIFYSSQQSELDSSQRSTMTIGQRQLIQIEENIQEALNRTNVLKVAIKETNPRLLISCICSALVDHLLYHRYSWDGVKRAIALSESGRSVEVVEKAWKHAETGDVYEVNDSQTVDSCSPRDDGSEWEMWTTDFSVLAFINRPVHCITDAQLKATLAYSYRLACRVAVSSAAWPQFTLVLHTMRHLDRKGYGLSYIMQAVALKIRGVATEEIEEMWRCIKKDQA